MEEIFWTTADGRSISVDSMSERHAKNALKMLIKKFGKSKSVLVVEPIEHNRADPWCCISTAHCHEAGFGCCLNPNN